MKDGKLRCVYCNRVVDKDDEWNVVKIGNGRVRCRKHTLRVVLRGPCKQAEKRG